LVPLPDNTLSKKGNKMKIKLLAIGTLGLLSFLSVGRNFTNTNAYLSTPTSYDYSYRYESVYGKWGFRTGAGGYTTYQPTYTRSVDSVSYYQYNGSLNYDSSGSTDQFTSWPIDLETLVQFRVSNTTWSSTGTDYVPTSSTIGSNVNLSLEKITFQFNNKTDNNYQVWFDSSTLTSSRVMSYRFNTIIINQANYSFVTLQSFIIPAGMNITIVYEDVNSSVYLDALYLKDLGVAYNATYQEGYDLGVSDGYEMGYDTGLTYGEIKGYDEGYVDGATDEGNQMIGAVEIFRSVFTGVRGIFEITVFPGISLGTLGLFPLLGVVLMFFKKVIQ